MSDHAHPLLSGRIAFSDEQSMLLDSAVTFCRERSPVASVRQLLTTDLGFDRGLWSEIAQLGWSGIAIPERFGGSGLSLGHTAVIAEPMGRHLLATPYVSTQLAIQGLLAGGNAAQQAAWLPRLADGGIGSVALFEDDGDWDLSRPQASATINGASAALQVVPPREGVVGGVRRGPDGRANVVAAAPGLHCRHEAVAVELDARVPGVDERPANTAR